MSKLNIIAAVGENMELGLNNQLLCHLPADLKHFKSVTSGFPIIMGRKTWDSLPFKPLPNRRNIVITRNRQLNLEGCEVVYSLEEALQLLDHEEECFVIGGATIYKEAISRAAKLYLTRIHASFKADVFFPPFNLNQWKLKEETFNAKDEKHLYDFTFQVYEKITQ